MAIAHVFAQPIDAQRYPDRPVRMIVPLAAGGPLDATRRALQLTVISGNSWALAST
jgi:tripartite-type tricarboxylate transporter receptor subunit TctC